MLADRKPFPRKSVFTEGLFKVSKAWLTKYRIEANSPPFDQNFENLPGLIGCPNGVKFLGGLIGRPGDETAGYQVAGGRLCWETTGAYEVGLVTEKVGTVAATALTSEDLDVLRLTNTSPFSGLAFRELWDDVEDTG